MYTRTDLDSCDASDYSTPEVEISALPGIATQLVDSIDSHTDSTDGSPLAATGTPTIAALQGAIDHAQAWKTAHSGDNVIVVFATDGDPDECDSDLGDIDNVAAAGVSGNPSVKTYVIGVGSDTSNLDGIAQGGGTSMAYLVDTGSGSTTTEFIDAMNAIRASELGCNYNIPVPTSGTPDFSAVNVEYTPSGGSEVLFPNVGGISACPASGNAWYYDNPANPTQILLCPSSCNVIKADTGGEIDILLGCQTIIS